MSQMAIDKAGKESEVEQKTAEQGRLVDKIASLQKIKKQTSAELESVKQYLKDLQPACVDGDSSYEDRKAARTKEIDALKQAEGILATAFDEPAPTMMKAQKKAFLAVHK